ncbi:MAG: hypothetical protein ACI4ON_03880 [Clostridia bacterium]
MLEFWKNEWKLFLEDIDSVKNAFAKLFGRKQDYLMLKSGTQQDAGEVLPQEEPVQASSISLENVSSEVTLDAEDGIKAGSAFAQENGVFADLATQGSEVAQATQPTYQLDGIDHKVTAYFGENIDELRVNMSGEKTQHEVLREYAQYFKPYTEAQDMCNSAFRKYYDRHALKIATEELPIEQARIIQNNVDLFIKGQEVFGENGQFIDSRVDTIFERIGIDQVNKVVGILHDNTEEGVNLQGERLFAEVITYMVDNGIKVEKGANVLEPIKSVLEEKLDDVHNNLKNHEDWNEEYQSLLSQERKYLYALNRIEQYETEQRISEFEEKLNDIESV